MRSDNSGVLFCHVSVVVTSSGFAGPNLAGPPRLNKATVQGWLYQTKPRWLVDSGRMFHWFVTQDRKTIGYEPRLGTYDIVVLKQTPQRLIFKVAGSHGIPLDLLSGHQIDKDGIIGKQYLARIKGDQILDVTESQ